MIAEARAAQYPGKYPGGDLKFSMPVVEDPYLSDEHLYPIDGFGLHVIYQGNERFFEDVTLMAPYANVPSELGRNRNLTRTDYDETLRTYNLPLPTDETQQEGDILWVANRNESVTVESFVGDPYPRQRKITIRRQYEAPRNVPHMRVESGIDMVGKLVEAHGFDPYDLTYLTGGTRETVQPTNLFDRMGARMTDSSASGTNLPDHYPKRIIRAVVFRS